MAIKVEKRGKYEGVKIHLEREECELLLQIHTEGSNPSYNADNISLKFTQKLGKKIFTLLQEEPNLLKPRTPKEIQHELETEFESAKLKLEALGKGKDWKEIHIK